MIGEFAFELTVLIHELVGSLNSHEFLLSSNQRPLSLLLFRQLKIRKKALIIHSASIFPVAMA